MNIHEILAAIADDNRDLVMNNRTGTAVLAEKLASKPDIEVSYGEAVMVVNFLRRTHSKTNVDIGSDFTLVYR